MSRICTYLLIGGRLWVVTEVLTDQKYNRNFQGGPGKSPNGEITITTKKTAISQKKN